MCTKSNIFIDFLSVDLVSAAAILSFSFTTYSFILVSNADEEQEGRKEHWPENDKFDLWELFILEFIYT